MSTNTLNALLEALTDIERRLYGSYERLDPEVRLAVDALVAAIKVEANKPYPS